MVRKKLTIPKNSKTSTEKNREICRRREEKKSQEEEEVAPDPLVTRVNNILNSIFSNIEVYINSQQIYNSDGLYAQKCWLSNSFKGAISEYKGVLNCEE